MKELVNINFDESICEGGSFELGGNIYTTSQTNEELILPASTSDECDTMALLNLEVLESLNEFIEEQICQGESSTPIGNEQFNTTGIYDVTLMTAQGCDSVVNLTLTVLDMNEFILDADYCIGETVMIGETVFTTDDSGVIVLDNADINGCDSIVNYDLRFLDELLVEISENLCEGDTYMFGADNLTESGTYTQNLVTNSGCDSTVVLTLNIQDYFEDEVLFLTEQFSNNDFPYNYNLLDNINLNGADASDLSIDLSQTQPSSVTVGQNQGELTFTSSSVVSSNIEVQFMVCHNDCMTDCVTGTLQLVVSDDLDCFREGTYDLPTAITPNGDGKNEVFFLDVLNQCSELFSDKEITIYNRWGSEVYQSKPYQNDWDGGNLPEGVYYYVMEFDLLKGLIQTGHVTIIR